MTKAPTDISLDNIAWIANFKFDFKRKSLHQSKAKLGGNKDQNDFRNGGGEGGGNSYSKNGQSSQRGNVGNGKIQMATVVQTAMKIIPETATVMGATLPTKTEAWIGLGSTIAAGNHATWNLRIVTKIRTRTQTLSLLSRSTKSTKVGRTGEERPPGEPDLMIMMSLIVETIPRTGMRKLCV